MPTHNTYRWKVDHYNSIPGDGFLDNVLFMCVDHIIIISIITFNYSIFCHSRHVWQGKVCNMCVHMHIHINKYSAHNFLYLYFVIPTFCWSGPMTCSDICSHTRWPVSTRSEFQRTWYTRERCDFYFTFKLLSVSLSFDANWSQLDHRLVIMRVPHYCAGNIIMYSLFACLMLIHRIACP